MNFTPKTPGSGPGDGLYVDLLTERAVTGTVALTVMVYWCLPRPKPIDQCLAGKELMAQARTL